MSKAPDISSSPVTPPEPASQPLRFRRDPETGLVVGHGYRYTEEGRIDWRAMVPVKYLYIASEHEAKVVTQQGKPLAECDLLAVPDDWLRIRVAGLNYLIQLRGVRSCTYPTLQTREGFAAAVCELELIPNVESDMMPETWSAMASACRTSMDTRMLPYLETFAENRAFGRAIKRALQINILSDIEVGGKRGKDDDRDQQDDNQSGTADDGAPLGFEPYHYLEQKCRAQKQPVSFDALKASALRLFTNPPAAENERLKGDPSKWTAFSDIEGIDAWLLINKLTEAAAKAAEKPAATTPAATTPKVSKAKAAKAAAATP